MLEERGRPVQRSNGSDRGCPLDTVIDPTMWHASGTVALDCCCSNASRRGGWAVAAVTGRGVPTTLARAGRVWW
jgi:hypothetical protein